MWKKGVVLTLGLILICSSFLIYTTLENKTSIRTEKDSNNDNFTETFTTLPKESDTFDPNDNFAQASPISEGFYDNLDLNADEDWYYFWVDAGRSVGINIFFNHSEGDLNLEIYNSSQQLVTFSNSADDNESIFLNVNSSDNYYIRVYNQANPKYALDIKIDDQFEPNNEIAIAPEVSKAYYGDLYCQDDDFYKVWFDSGDDFDVDVYHIHSLGDIDVELYNESSGYLTGSYSPDDNETLFWTASYSGYYYIKVYMVNTPNNYSLEIHLNIFDDSYEENDDFGSAKVLSNGYYSNLRCQDPDWYKVYFNDKEEFTIDLIFTNITGDLNLELRDYNDLTLKTSYSTTDNESISWIAAYTGYYYIFVLYSSTPNDYEMDIYFSGGSGDDSYEENDDFSSAWDLSKGYYSNLKCQDEDWFKFWIYEGEEFSVDIFFNDVNGDLDAELYDDSYNHLQGAYTSTDNEFITWNAGYTGYFYLRIYYCDTPNDFNLDIYLSSGADDPYEENDIFNDAKEIYNGYFSSLVCQDDDWFKLWLKSGKKISINIYFSNGTGNLDMELYNDGYGFIQGSYSIENDEEITFSPSYSGYHYIKVYNVSTAPNNYDLDIYTIDDRFEPNNDFWNAPEIFTGMHRHLDCFDDDWYKVWIEDNEWFSIDIFFKHSDGNLHLELYDKYNSMIFRADSWDDDEYLSYTATYTGYYYVYVYYFDNDNHYDMKISVQEETIFQEDFEGTISSKWSGFDGDNYWHVTSQDSSPNSPTHSLWCGNEGSGTYDKKIDGYSTSYKDIITLENIDLRNYCYAELSFDYKLQTGSSSFDNIRFAVQVLGNELYLSSKYTNYHLEIGDTTKNGGWSNRTFDISFFCGYEHVDLLFIFETDEYDNNYEGFMMDNLKIKGMRDDISVGTQLGIHKGDIFHYRFNYVNYYAWTHEIFAGPAPQFTDKFIKIQIMNIEDKGDYWDVTTRFWDPWDDFDEFENTDEMHYKVYKNPLNMKDGCDFFVPNNNMIRYLERADNFDNFESFDIVHWHDSYHWDYKMECKFGDFSVELIYFGSGILKGMIIRKNYGDFGPILEMWYDDYEEEEEEGEDEDEGRRIPGFDIITVLCIVSIASIGFTIRMRKLKKFRKT
ncbi:MAG: hypothetical protein GF383_16555 [Candidatus Lokiarchaeota archaeon]|nr:hypothetical protein [Candidatus Lokiarchaeota archaeon]MBD3343395.1 hypothetical protein [Candidatus Lokiarchaeota archaeon]